MMQQLTQPDAKTQIYTDSLTITVVEEDMCYVYHKPCLGLALVHPLDVAGLIADYREKREMTRHTIRACHCFSEPSPPVDIQQILANIYVSLGACRTIEDARMMMKELASRYEMAEQEV